MPPDERGIGGGEALQEALGDEADLDVAMIGTEFAPDGAAVVITFIVKELIAAAARGGMHIHHPEMVGPSAEGVESLLEGDLDFEAQGVEADDLGRAERQVGGHEDKAAAGGMDDGDEAHEAAGGTPEQIARGPPHADTLFAVSGALHGLQGRIKPVSYTHLDVYKRQVHALPEGPLGPGAVLIRAAVVLLDAFDVVHGLGALLG